jgi:hypothetical protein
MFDGHFHVNFPTFESVFESDTNFVKNLISIFYGSGGNENAKDG